MLYCCVWLLLSDKRLTSRRNLSELLRHDNDVVTQKKFRILQLLNTQSTSKKFYKNEMKKFGGSSQSQLTGISRQLPNMKFLRSLNEVLIIPLFFSLVVEWCNVNWLPDSFVDCLRRAMKSFLRFIFYFISVCCEFSHSSTTRCILVVLLCSLINFDSSLSLFGVALRHVSWMNPNLTRPVPANRFSQHKNRTLHNPTIYRT